jgi:hypothetical protein
MKKITKKKLGQILANALVIGKVVGSRKRGRLPKSKPAQGFEDEGMEPGGRLY